MKLNLRTVKYGGIIAIPLFFVFCKSAKEMADFGPVIHPVDNPSSEQKVELGRKLFFDKRLSIDNSVSCGSCHRPEWAFTDRKKVSEGVEGRMTERNAPSILNAGYLPTVMFDAHLETLEKQVIVPIQEHVEMNMNMKELIIRMRKIPEYAKAAEEIYNREFDAWVLTRSIAAFERSLISQNSRFDRYYYGGNKNSLTKAEKTGWKIFSEQLQCTQCHPAPHFTTYEAVNNGLYEEYGADKGRFRIHHDSADIGKFKVPSLRNVELTYPYMHDGSMPDLESVIEHYGTGGSNHVNKDPRITRREISDQDRKYLIQFLSTLTDTSYMKNFRP